MPDRCDADQEGIKLAPASTYRMIAREEANGAILQHIHLCPFSVDDVNKRLRTIEMGLAKLVGFMIGSGLLGGVAGAVVNRLWPQ